MKIRIPVYLIVCTVAALTPFLPVKPVFRTRPGIFHGWPEQFDGVHLKRLALSEREKCFAEGLPGRIARFSVGERELIIRWISQTSGKLLSAWDCFKGLDDTLNFGPVWLDQDNMYWRSFEAATTTEKFRVLERIYDEVGNNWTDTSSWYWAALFKKTKGPWWIVTVIEQQE